MNENHLKLKLRHSNKSPWLGKGRFKNKNGREGKSCCAALGDTAEHNSGGDARAVLRPGSTMSDRNYSPQEVKLQVLPCPTSGAADFPKLFWPVTPF